MLNVRAKWQFRVGVDEHGDVITHWSVWSDEDDGLPTQGEHGDVKGPLHAAIFEAYDHMGITCPFVLDKDLLRWGGHREEAAT